MVGGGSNEVTLAYPGEPLGTNQSLEAIVFPTSFIGLLADIPGASCTQSTSDGLFGILVTDCTGAPITDSSNITVTVQQNSTMAGDAPIDVGALFKSVFSSSALEGFFLVCNVPPGTTTVNASYMSKTFLQRTVSSVANEATETIVRPGY